MAHSKKKEENKPVRQKKRKEMDGPEELIPSHRITSHHITAQRISSYQPAQLTECGMAHEFQNAEF
jgi:hypothetical protein